MLKCHFLFKVILLTCYLHLAVVDCIKQQSCHKYERRHLSFSDPRIVECTQNRDICTFDDIMLSRSGYRFRPLASNASEVKLVVIKNSSIEWFSSDMCRYFPNLKEIDIFGAGLQGFDGDALLGCRELEVFESTGDQITTIPLSLFWGNRKTIRTIAFYGAPIERIDHDQFAELTELRFLTIAGSRVSHFPAESIRNSEYLIGLYLYGNNLLDLDGEYILKKFSQLRSVAFSDNDMVCSRVQELNELFVYNGIDSYWWVHERAKPRPKDVKTSKHWGVICIIDPEEPTEPSTTTTELSLQRE